MKKAFLPGLLALLVGSTLSAQVRFGVKAGYNLAHLQTNLGASEDFSFSALSAFNAGILAQIPLPASLSLQPELLYSGQGAKYDDDGDPGKIQMGMIDIPVMVKYSYKGAFIETGPQFGLLISAKNHVDGGSLDIKNDLKSTAMDWGFGVGYESNSGLGIDIRYELGLAGLIKSGSNTDYFLYRNKAKSGVFQIGLFYMMGRMKK
ncbi:MAG TPA: porin family protein [Puia sp.]|nr:porin family protein [Puia sp.]